MAIVTHRSSKNNRYDDVLTYLKYEHTRHSVSGRVWYEPVRDENGLLQERSDCLLAAFDSQCRSISPEDWAGTCERTNLRHQKPMGKNRRRNHTYIVSFPEEDRPNITKEKLMEVAQKMAHNYFRGYEVLIAVHFDKTKIPHFHLVINSIRDRERSKEAWMMRNDDNEVLPCETMAGGMHQDSTGLRRALNDWLLAVCRHQGWQAKDNNAIADQHKGRRYLSKNNYLCSAITSLAPKCNTLDTLTQQLMEQYGIQLKRRGHTISLLHPESKKAVRLTTLGLDTSVLFQHMEDLFSQSITVQSPEYEKQYIDWVIARRKYNEKKARILREQIDSILRAKEKARNESYNKEDYRTLNRLISHTSYLAASLATEKDKADRLLSTWDRYFDPSCPIKERVSNRSFVEWSGCDPNNHLEYQWLCEQRNLTDLEEKMANELCARLIAESDHWKYHNDLAHLEHDIIWLKRRECQIKGQIKYWKKRSNKLWDITCNCKQAAMRRSPWDYKNRFFEKPPPGWENYSKWYSQWAQCSLRQFKLEEQLKEIKFQRRTTAKQKHSLKTNSFFHSL